MTMPKLPDNIFDESTAALKGLLRYKTMYKYKARAIQYEIHRRKQANKVFYKDEKGEILT